MSIYGFPRDPGGGSSYTIGGGLQAVDNGNGTFTLSASGPYITYFYDSTITGSKSIVAGNNVVITQQATSITISAQATGSGAPTVSSYITGVTEASLPNSSVLTPGNGITVVTVPGGASTVGVASTITGANILTHAAGDTIFPNRRQLLFGSGLSNVGGTNTLTLAVTGQGSVTSIDVAAPFQTSSGAVTTAGTITLSYQNQAAGTLLIAPSGSSGTPTFRRILGQDLPIFAGSNVTVTTNATGGLVISSTAGGSGTVTSLSVGDLSPVFTSSVANATTTPAVTYSLTNAAQNAALMGPKTGGAGSPTYRAITGQDLGNLVAGSNITISAVGDTLVFASTASGGSSYLAGAGIGISGSTISVNGVTSTTSTPYAPAATDFIILVNSTGGAKVVNLPAPASNLGRILHIKKFDTSGNTVTVNPNASETIDGASSYILSASYQEVSLACDGTNWAVF